MALSTIKISDTIEFCKRMSFNRNPVIGNSLQPALGAASMVAQTVLSPPFSWPWNNQELAFTCNPTPSVATITNIAVDADGLLTVTCTNSFFYGNPVLLAGLTTATGLNGQLVSVATASGTQFTAQTNFATYASHSDTGTATVQTTQDYQIAAQYDGTAQDYASAFSHIEHCSVLDINQTPPTWIEMDVKGNLALDTNSDRPRFLSVHTQDAAGDLTFRVMPAPDKAYPVSVHMQLAAPNFTSVNQTWSPIPDYFQYVYNWGFLSLIWNFSDDPRATMASQKFTSALLSRAEGMSEDDRNIFLNNWNMLTSGQQMKQQQGVQARQV